MLFHQQWKVNLFIKQWLILLWKITNYDLINQVHLIIPYGICYLFIYLLLWFALVYKVQWTTKSCIVICLCILNTINVKLKNSPASKMECAVIVNDLHTFTLPRYGNWTWVKIATRSTSILTSYNNWVGWAQSLFCWKNYTTLCSFYYSSFSTICSFKSEGFLKE